MHWQATAGLRLLKGDSSEKILQAVKYGCILLFVQQESFYGLFLSTPWFLKLFSSKKEIHTEFFCVSSLKIMVSLLKVRDLLKNESSLKYKAEWVTILEGSQEAAYIWVSSVLFS